MKPIAYVFVIGYVLWTLVSCATVVAPKDPVTGIRQDAPEEWGGTPNPLDTPEATTGPPVSEGQFGHEWLYR